jgi:hypothetical protein
LKAKWLGGLDGLFAVALGTFGTLGTFSAFGGLGAPGAVWASWEGSIGCVPWLPSASASETAHASRTAMASVKFRIATSSHYGSGRIRLPPARHCLNPRAAFSVDSDAAAHAWAPNRAKNISFNA